MRVCGFDGLVRPDFDSNMWSTLMNRLFGLATIRFCLMF